MLIFGSEMTGESKQPENKYIIPATLNTGDVSVTVKCLGIDDPIAGGNKWYKMKYNLCKARELGYDRILSFGGAFSNHIAALARTCKEQGFKSTGVIRGEIAYADNVTLTRARQDGMNLFFVSRSNYRRKHDPEFLRSLIPEIEKYFVIPEGGSNEDGLRGCREILSERDREYDIITVCCGTGVTAAGIILSLQPNQQSIGFSVLRDGGSVDEVIKGWIEKYNPSFSHSVWKINHDFHFGGFGKTTRELDEFCTRFSYDNGIPIEPVYTGKMFYGLEKLIRNGYFPKGTKILAIHTGGLQYLEK